MANYLTSDEIKNIELDLLIHFDNFCKKYGLYYTLGGGSLLGAVRHKGFIPWDDDIDVMMPRKDFNKLMRIYDKFNDRDDYELLMPNSKYNVDPYLKITNNRTMAKHNETVTQGGLWIDIFPLDNLPADDKALKRLFKATRLARAAVISKDTDFKNCKKDHKVLPKLLLKICVSIMGYERFLRLQNTLVQQYNKRKTGYIGCALWGYGPGERMVKEEYLKPVLLSFEGRQFNAPSCWDQYLTGLYGDYMKLPPVEKRKTHAVKAWYVNK